MPVALPGGGNRGGNRFVLIGGLALAGLLAIPVLAVLVLEGGLLWSCTSKTVASGVAEGKIAWRISRMDCKGSDQPFYDVAVGAEDKTLVTALTARGAPVPLEVVRLGENRIGVRLDRPAPSGTTGDVVPVRLRKSGSPVERIDLQASIKSGPVR